MKVRWFDCFSTCTLTCKAKFYHKSKASVTNWKFILCIEGTYSTLCWLLWLFLTTLSLFTLPKRVFSFISLNCDVIWLFRKNLFSNRENKEALWRFSFVNSLVICALVDTATLPCPSCFTATQKVFKKPQADLQDSLPAWWFFRNRHTWFSIFNMKLNDTIHQMGVGRDTEVTLEGCSSCKDYVQKCCVSSIVLCLFTLPLKYKFPCPKIDTYYKSWSQCLLRPVSCLVLFLYPSFLPTNILFFPLHYSSSCRLVLQSCIFIQLSLRGIVYLLQMYTCHSL